MSPFLKCRSFVLSFPSNIPPPTSSPHYIVAEQHTIGALEVVPRSPIEYGTLLLTPGDSTGQKFSENSTSRAVGQVKI